ncbi:MAG TPA: EamA family transporter, partial [Ktedonobacteraceae bacterium]|nr:EamA family transporter [Ktedonobacteraceae bacterium]
EMATIMQTVPLFSTLFAVLLLHDSITPLQAVGAFLALLGGVIASLSDRKSIPKISTDETSSQQSLLKEHTYHE